jgi:ribose-phosphate pyrophosphokinase
MVLSCKNSGVKMDIIYTRNSEKLARSIAERLDIPVVAPNVRRFNNGEICVWLHKPIRDAIVVASTETDGNWIELFLLLDALRGADRVILCLSYMGYSRQDQQNPNESCAAGMLARLLETMHISQCIIVDNHSEPLLRVPTQHISAKSIFEKDISDKFRHDQIVIVSPDLGGVRRAYDISRSLKCDFIICNKAKTVFGELKKIDPIGSVNDKICILVDDMVDSGATLCYAANSLMRAGSRGVLAYCTHGVLSNGALERLNESDITEIVLTDSVFGELPSSSKIRKLSIDSLIADAIRCIV